MQEIWRIPAGAAAAALLCAGIFARPAQADWGDYHHAWHPDGWELPGIQPAPEVSPPPYYDARQPVSFAPPPVVYAPPPAYYAPAISFDVNVR